MNAPFAPATENTSLSERWLNHSGRVFTIAWLLIGTGSIGLGWHYRHDGYLSAASGLGYWLGITGGSGMLLLLTYSLRKRWRLLRRAMPVKWWFQAHMSLGIIGPLCILFHSNFQLGSLNSTVALVCMLLVAGSGIIGRYIYTRIHFGLFGERIRMRELITDFQTLQAELATLTRTGEQRQQIDELFANFTEMVKRQEQSSGLRFWRERAEAKKFSRALQQLISSLIKHDAQFQQSTVELHRVHQRIQQDYAILLAILAKLPTLKLFEKMFSLWHVLHIPIFILMIITAIIHVVVVHMY